MEFEFTVIPLLRVFEPLGREIRAGTTALDIGEALIPHESIQLRQTTASANSHTASPP